MENGMGKRGVARPMMKMGKDEGKSESKTMHMSQDDRMGMLMMHHKQSLWVYWLVVMLGFWVLFSPLTFDYGKNPFLPSGGRSVWLDLASRVAVMEWSDIISGTLLVVFGWRSLTPNRPISIWICCFVGIWLSMAPLIFWSPSAVAYMNDTLVGAMVIGLTILIPGMPNMIMYMKMGSEVPPGWSYNPSSWPQRWIMIVMGFMGWMVSRYLAAFQLGYIDTVWDPFFGESTINVLNSTMSHSMPVSDAGLGSFAYTFEFLMGFMGSPARWRTMPWMVLFFGILVIPLGLVHIFLVISQPVLVGAWCTFCLMAAAIMLPMLPLEGDEVIAMFQFMKKAKKRGDNLWKVFWFGGSLDTMEQDERSPELVKFPDEKNSIFQASIWGMTFPWTLTVSMLLGVGLMFAPGVFGDPIQTSSATLNHVGGALVVVMAVISMGEVFRMVRYLNVPLGLGIAAGIWFTDFPALGLALVSTVAGILVAALALPKRIQKEHYGGWDDYVR
jgi:hypothetical protein